MKLQILVVAFVLVGCGGVSFTGFNSVVTEADGGLGGAPAEIDSGGNGGAVDSDSGPGSGGASGGSGGVPTSTGGATGGSPVSTGGTPGSGGAANAAVCCVFPLTGGPKTSSCDVAAPWFCTGGQTYSCAQQGQCTLGMPCYFTTGPYGGTVQPCATACDTPVTHDNGAGQIWQDCVPRGTYNKDQATKACKASGAVMCSESTRCGPTVYEVQGFDADGYVIGEWGYGDFAAGLVSLDFNLCGADDPGRRQWR